MEQQQEVAALRQLVELDNRVALVSVKLLDRRRVVMRSLGPKFNLVFFFLMRSSR